MSIGRHDNPVSSSVKDRLSMKARVDGLASFVQLCETPLTISIQGVWGTGKTSFVNMVMEKVLGENVLKQKSVSIGSKTESINSAPDIIYIPFNIWQFVQFDMSEQLSTNLIIAITKEIGKGLKGEKEKKRITDIVEGMEILKATSKIGLLAANNFIKEKYDIDIKGKLEEAGITEAEKYIRKTKETVTALDTISNLKNNLRETIFARLGITEEMQNNPKMAETIRKKRIVFFVDDLDRLAPDKAIEVLEVLKMFLDCEHCVFVLAIDYNVVINGVQIKYNSSITEEKGRDFFEKMIQVVYTLPNSMNRTDRFIAEILQGSGQNMSLANEFADLVKKGNKDNPRAIKRLVNSYLLVTTMKEVCPEIKLSQADRVIQFAVICLQNICPAVYDYLSAQFSGIYNYEKSVEWFNILHKYCYEMSRFNNSNVKIRPEKLEQWGLINNGKVDRTKIEFLCTFFDKINRNIFVKVVPGKQLHIHDILCLKRAIQWNDEVHGNDDVYTHFDTIARIDVCGFPKEETSEGTIEEAFVNVSKKMLMKVRLHGLQDKRTCSFFEEMSDCGNDNEMSLRDEFLQMVELFDCFFSDESKEDERWTREVIGGKEIWIKSDFDKVEEAKRFDVIIGALKILSRYTNVGFSLFKDRRGKEAIINYDSKEEGKIVVENVSFITVNGVTIQIPKKDAELAYFRTIRYMLEALDDKTATDCIKNNSTFIKICCEDDSMLPDSDEMLFCEFGENNYTTEDTNISTEEVLLENESWIEDGSDDMLFGEFGENSYTTAETGISVVKTQEESYREFVDDLDDVTPIEYEDEYDKILRNVIVEENADGWYDMNRAQNGWRKETIMIEGYERNILIYVGNPADKCLMAMNAYKLSKYAGVDYSWYEDAYMQKELPVYFK